MVAARRDPLRHPLDKSGKLTDEAYLLSAAMLMAQDVDRQTRGVEQVLRKLEQTLRAGRFRGRR